MVHRLWIIVPVRPGLSVEVAQMGPSLDGFTEMKRDVIWHPDGFVSDCHREA